MTRCDRCGNEVGELLCGHCREEAKREGVPAGIKRIPVLFYIPERKTYVAGCRCLECPWNRGGYCSTEWTSIEQFKILIHEFDGDNCVHQKCG
jgi:hypothetical protein